MNDLSIHLGHGTDCTLTLDGDERFRHCYTIGVTGTGKSTFLANLIIQDMRAGRGVTVLDAHGDLARTLLDYVPPSRSRETVFFNPADSERIASLNIFRSVEPEMSDVAVASIVATFAHIFGLSQEHTPRLLHYLRQCIVALMEVPHASMASLFLMLSDTAFRDRVVARINNPVCRRFWLHEFAGNPDRYNREAMAPILSRVEAFLTYRSLLRIVGQRTATIDLASIIDDGKIFICDLNQGIIGEEPSQLLGSLIVTQLQLAAMARSGVPERDRRAHFAYIDEFQNFTSGSYDALFSGARKMRLGLTVAHQHKAQLRDETFAAVRGNAGTLVVFRTAADDAQDFVRDLAPLSVREIVELPPFQAWLRRPKNPARRHLTTLPLPALTRAPRRAAIIIDQSRATYGRARTKVDRDLDALLGG